jgi:hypothetical protein
MIGASHVPTFQGEVWLVYNVVARALFTTGVLVLFYVALEPYVRRRTPRRLVSWGRLMAGDWRDPLVGRDVLVGVLLGIWINLMIWFGELLGRRLGFPPELIGTDFDTLLGLRGIAPIILSRQVPVSLLHGLGFVFLLLLFGLLLKGERRVAVGTWLLFVAVLMMAGNHWVLNLSSALAEPCSKSSCGGRGSDTCAFTTYRSERKATRRRDAGAPASGAVARRAARRPDASPRAELCRSRASTRPWLRHQRSRG